MEKLKRKITIAGGGLAGLSLGIALARRGVPVTLHEAGSYPRHRVCGEFICGVDTGILEELHIRDLLDRAVRHEASAWFRNGRKIFQASLPAPALGISRYQLDDALRQRFQESGGILHENSRLAAEASEGLVWTAGRIPDRGHWLGLKCHASDVPLTEDLEMHLGSNGYVGLGRIEDGKVNVCGLFRRNTRLSGKGPDLLREYLAAGGLEGVAARLDTLIPQSFAAVAGFRLGWQRKSRPMLALGDACGMIPPFTGNGMSMALESAAVAAPVVREYAEGRGDWTKVPPKVQRNLARRFSSRMLWGKFLHPFLTVPAGQRLFAAMARIGLLPFEFCFRTCR